MKLPVIYLAGAIRDDHPEDIEWRERMIERLKHSATILSPLGGKTRTERPPYRPGECSSEPRVKWTQFGRAIPPKKIVLQDWWCVDNSNIVVANVTSLAEGYPSIGTMMELGRATARGSLIYLIMERPVVGHANAMYGVHPFLEVNAADVFTSLDEALDGMACLCDAYSGRRPSYIPGTGDMLRQLTLE